MFNVFGSLKELLKLDEICIDNTVFKLHYKATVIILMTFAFIVTSKQYFGVPIKCLHDEVKPELMDAYCWTHPTFTVVRAARGKVGDDLVAAGVGQYKPHAGDTQKFHDYYQWVCFMLFFQAASFYVPRYLWKAWEGGRMKVLVLNLDCPVVSEDSKNERKELLIDYLVSHLHNQNLYAVRFFICQVLNFVNVVAQFYLTNRFLNGDFLSYGLKALGHIETDPDIKNNIMDLVFPKVTKCKILKYGSSGDIENKDVICVLPLNIVNEKIYLVLWFWFVILIIVTLLELIFHIVVIFNSQVRIYVLQARSGFSRQNYIETIGKNCQIGDWFTLDQLGKNIDSVIYREILSDLVVKLKE